MVFLTGKKIKFFVPPTATVEEFKMMVGDI